MKAFTMVKSVGKDCNRQFVLEPTNCIYKEELIGNVRIH